MSFLVHSLSVIGVGNMASAIIEGISSSDINVSSIILFDKNKSQYDRIKNCRIPVLYAESVSEAISMADCVLLSVKPQNYADVLAEIAENADFNKKLYISIGAGITGESVSAALGGACVIRVLPNVPMLIGKGLSVICKNPKASAEDFDFVSSVFASAGNILLIDESEMNRIIGVTSSSPAYVFKFINAIYMGAKAQGLDNNELLSAICDTVIGSALMLKYSSDTPEELISKVASKGGTTEQALKTLEEFNFDKIIEDAMIACTVRADELGASKNNT